MQSFIYGLIGLVILFVLMKISLKKINLRDRKKRNDNDSGSYSDGDYGEF